MSQPSFNPLTLPQGYRLGDYVIQDIKGQGGFGIAYLAQDIHLQNLVIIKEYFPNGLASRDGQTVTVFGTKGQVDYERGMQRFLEEGRALARFSHPAVVRILKYLQQNNTAYLVMEFIDGEPLDTYLQRKHSLSPQVTAHLAAELLDGLAVVHQHNLIHRDIKPGNIMLRPGGKPVLIDFGAAKEALAEKSHSVVVTPGYGALEQYSSKAKLAPATDLYALGATLYKCLTGQTPEEATQRAVEDSHIPLGRDPKASQYPPGLIKLIDQCLQIKEKDRPQSAQEAKALLEQSAPHPQAQYSESSQAFKAMENSAEANKKKAENGRVKQQPDITLDRSVEANKEEATAKTNKIRIWIGVFASVFVLAGGGYVFLKYNTVQPDVSVMKNEDVLFKKYLKAAEKGDAEAQFKLGVMYDKGQGVPQDDAEAVKWYRKAAEQGDADAQFKLGFMYINGRGVPQDNAEAVKWFRKVAEQGDAGGQFSLGVMYRAGKGLPQDNAEAVKWFRKAAEQGDADGQFSLGVMYLEGRGVPQDDTEAVKWFRKAAEQGDAYAQFALGDMYEKGRGVPQDDTEAVKWFRKSAEQGDADAQFALGDMYKKGRGVPQDDTEAVKWYRKAAEQGDVNAQFNLGLIYVKGQGVPQDDVEAVNWYRKAAEQGNAMAQNNLGIMYRDSQGVLQDDVEAVKWLRLAAEQGLSEAQTGLGFMYREGRGMPQDDTEAVNWYRKAAEQGHAGAQNGLGFMYKEGRGVSQDDEEAVKWNRKAAEQGHAGAQHDLGFMYREGRGVPQNNSEAVKWYRKAAEQGNAYAQNGLGFMYREGRGVPQDDTEAVKWYRMAAEQGNSAAQYGLGFMFEKGRGVPQDDTEAVKWYHKAAEQGVEVAQRRLLVLQKKGVVPPNPTDSTGRYWTPDGIYESSGMTTASLRSEGGQSVLRDGNGCSLSGRLKPAGSQGVWHFVPLESDGMSCPNVSNGWVVTLYVIDGPGVRALGNASRVRLHHPEQNGRSNFSGEYNFKEELP